MLANLGFAALRLLSAFYVVSGFALVCYARNEGARTVGLCVTFGALAAWFLFSPRFRGSLFSDRI